MKRMLLSWHGRVSVVTGLLVLLTGACLWADGVAKAPPDGTPEYVAWKESLLSGASGQAKEYVLVQNDYVQLGCADNGGWGLYTVQGDPATPDDNDKRLMYNLYGSTNGLSVKIDGTLHDLSDSTADVTTEMALGPGGTYASMAWTIVGVTLTARYELVASDSGREDTARITYTFYNPPGKAARTIGFKVGLDTMIGWNDAARLATATGIVEHETGYGMTGTGGSYANPVPDFWQAFEEDDIANPGVIGQGTFVGGGATKPDKFVVGQWWQVSYGSNFDYTPTGEEYGDSAVGMWWLDRSLPAGASMSFVVLYGLGSVTSGGGDLVMGLSAPATLAPDGSDFSPNPFTVLVQLQNGTGGTLTNLPVTIALPACLSLASGSTTQIVSSLADGATMALAFSVYADPACGGTTPEYSVTAGAGQPYAVTLTKTVELPVVVTDCDSSPWNFVHLLNVGYYYGHSFPEIVATVSVDTPAGRACELGMSNFAVDEDGVPQTLTSLTCAATGGSVADIAFVFDDTGSMGGQIAAMKAQANAFATAIVNAGVNARFALVSFGDKAEIGLDLHFTSNVANFQAAVDALTASGGGDTPEAALDGVWTAATQLSWRPAAQRFFILITDAPTHYAGDGSGLADRGMAETIALVNGMGGSVFAVGPALAKGQQLLDNEGQPDTSKAYGAASDVKTLALDTGGNWQNINTVDFTAWINEIVDIVTSVYTLTYTSSNPARDGNWRDVVVTVYDPEAEVPRSAKSGLSDCDEGRYQAPNDEFDCDQGEGDFVHVMAVGYAASYIFPEITATVRVDSEAGYECELTREDFAAWEDGVWQTITSVTCAGTGGSVADIAIVFDDTGSMGGIIGTMKTKATQFVNDIVAAGVDARFALVSFKDEETIRQEFTTDVVTFQTAVNALVASGGGDTPETAFDGVMLALTGLVWREGAQRLVVVITDASSHYRGDGTAFAAYTLDEVVNACTGSGTSVFAVGPALAKGQLLDNDGNLVTFVPPKTERLDDVRLLAERTGGFWQNYATADFGAFIDHIVRVVTSLYTVVYTTSNRVPDGTWRQVYIQVTDPVEGTDCDDGTYLAPYAPLDCENGQGHDFVWVQGAGYAADEIFPQVTATVRVDTAAGRNCDLTTANFALSEDGVVQRITSVTCSGTAGSVADIAICFDDTGSMGGVIATMKAKATQFVQDIVNAGIDARFALVSFKDDETLDMDFTADASSFQSAINALVASGGDDTPETSLDAAMLAVNGLAWRAGSQRIVVLITDAPTHYRGDGTAFSEYTMSEAIAAANAAGVAVFAIGPVVAKGTLQDNTGATVPWAATKAFDNDVRYLAEGTGGFWQNYATADFGEFLDHIVDVVTSLYTVTYTTSNATRDGTWRHLVVAVTDPVEGTDCDNGQYRAPLECLDLAVTPSDLYAVCLTGTNPDDLLFRVSNACAGRLEYIIDEDCPWLSVWPTSGSSSWDWNNHWVEFNASGLAAGSYEWQIYVVGGGQSEMVTVHLTVTDLLVTRDFPEDCFGPGDTLDVAVTFRYAGSLAVSSLALYEALPAGWSFVQIVSGDPWPDMQTGATANDLEFYWIEIPAFPYTLVYRVQAPALKTDPAGYGWHCFAGEAAWRTTGDEMWTGVYGEECIELVDCTEPCAPHMVDQNRDWGLQLTPELTRMIQFYNRRGYHGQAGTEDGYAPGVGATSGGPHQTDQNRDWVIQLSPELTRIIQFYNSGGYRCQAGTEDGYAPGRAAKAAGGKGVLTSARSFGSALYTAGTTLDVTITLTHSTPAALSSLAVQETLPAGWTYQSVVTTPAPPIRPALGATGTLGFAWITVPTVWPVRLTYRVSVPAGTFGTMTFNGSASFREDGGETTVTTPATSIEGTHTLTYTAGAGGQIVGTAVQTVPHGGAGAAVTARATFGFVFVGWDDNPATPATRTDTNVTEDRAYTAIFRVANPTLPPGTFLAVTDPTAVEDGRGLWNLSGVYNTAAKDHPLVLNVVHDSKGKLTGTATYAPAGLPALSNIPIKGSVRSGGGQTLAKLTLKGANAAKTVSLSLTLNLAVNPATRRLTGPMTGSVTLNGVRTAVAANQDLAIPEPMDGTWTLNFELAYGAAISGTAQLALANGDTYDCVVRGAMEGEQAVLSLAGAPGDPAAVGLKIRAVITPLEGEWARLHSFLIEVFGQQVRW